MADLLTVIGNLGNNVAGGPTDGDLDNSGDVTVSDLLTVIAALGSACG